MKSKIALSGQQICTKHKLLAFNDTKTNRTNSYCHSKQVITYNSVVYPEGGLKGLKPPKFLEKEKNFLKICSIYR